MAIFMNAGSERALLVLCSGVQYVPAVVAMMLISRRCMSCTSPSTLVRLANAGLCLQPARTAHELYTKRNNAWSVCVNGCPWLFKLMSRPCMPSMEQAIRAALLLAQDLQPPQPLLHACLHMICCEGASASLTAGAPGTCVEGMPRHRWDSISCCSTDWSPSEGNRAYRQPSSLSRIFLNKPKALKRRETGGS